MISHENRGLGSQVFVVDQILDLVRYTGLEYMWQKYGPRQLAVDEIVAFPSAGIDDGTTLGTPLASR